MARRSGRGWRCCRAQRARAFGCLPTRWPRAW
ncbi:hypothetical protein E3T34_02845 [Cryobacterium sp. TMT1-62]|nr:hypothetical protein E3T34_02845 [Cryobacterium sp. TMT1-62]